MEIKIFYSWQSDLPSNKTRTFIQEALEKVAEQITGDVLKADRPVDIDSATKGVAGAVNIAETILKKIEKCQIFVADVSIVGEMPAVKTGKPPRKSPNPNVLFELGYAFKHLGENRMIFVMNSEYGKPEDLPFDLRMRRVVGFESGGGSQKAIAKRTLENDLESAIKIILSEIREAESEHSDVSLENAAIEAIEAGLPSQIPLIKKYMQWLHSELVQINARYVLSDNHIEGISQTIRESESLSISFARVAESASTMGNLETCRRLYSELLPVFEQYRVRTVQNPSGRHDDDFDFYKFIGHELFVLFFACQIRDGNWTIISELLKQPIFVKGLPGDESFVTIGYIPQTIESLQQKKRLTKSRQISLHADELAERYRNGEIGKIVSFGEFMDADLFLFLYFEFNKAESDYYRWIPHTGPYNQNVPRFLHEAESASRVNDIGSALLVNRDQFVEKLAKARAKLNDLYFGYQVMGPLRFFDPEKLGSR